MKPAWLTPKWVTKKRYKQLVNKVLRAVNRDPAFENVFLNWIIYWEPYEKIVELCKRFWVKVVRSKIERRIRDFSPSYLFLIHPKIYVRGNKYKQTTKYSILTRDIIDAIADLRERQRVKKEVKTINSKEQIQQETRVFTYLLNNPQAMTELKAVDIAKITDADEKLVENIISWEIKPVSTKAQELLLDKNYKILEKWKKMILEKMDKIDVEKMWDLKALSDILDTSFKQNRLLEGKSTENALVWVTDIYEAIIKNADSQKKEID